MRAGASGSEHSVFVFHPLSADGQFAPCSCHSIDGIFGSRTEEALKGYQRRTSLRADGVCGCNSWKKISTAVLGVGRTKTTID